MKQIVKSLFLICFLLMIFPLHLNADIPQKRNYTIAFVIDGEPSKFESDIKILKEEINILIGEEFDIVYSNLDSFVGNWTIESVNQAIQSALDDPEVDIIITIGVLSSQLSKSFIPLSKPLFASFVINYKLQEFPFDNGTSGVNNFNYQSLSPSLINDYKTFKDMVPHDNVAFLIDEFLIAALPNLTEQAELLSKEVGVSFEIVPVKSSIADTLQAMPKSAEAAYIVSITGISKEDKKQFYQGLIQLDLPSYSYYGKADVELGVLASMSPEIEFGRFARRIALNIQRYLFGESLSILPVLIDEQKHLLLNQETIWGLNINLPWKYLQDAEILGASEERPYQQINIKEAVIEGVAQNVNLAAALQEVYIGYQDLKRAYSYLFPQIDVSSYGGAIDKPRAYVSAGLYPQRFLLGKATISQTIYSNERFGQVDVEKWQQAARCEKYRTNRLDLIFEIARTYLNILRVSSVENIQRNNLRITRTNLKVAQQRVNAGQARYSEIYRWESEIAKKRANLIISHFNVQKNKVHLKRLLNLPMDGSLNIKDLEKNLDFFILTPDLFGSYITSDVMLEKISRLSIFEAFDNSPELREIQDQIYAQSALLGITKRAFYAPEITFRGEFTNRWWEDGAGTVGIAHTGGDDWLVGINVQLPLYTGGRRTANNRQALEKLKQLYFVKENVIQGLDERIRDYYLDASASYGVIKNARIATTAATNNMDLIYQAYIKGKNTIIDVLDAQNQLLISELDETNAIFDFFTSTIGVQKEMGNYDFLLSPIDRQRVKNHLQQFLFIKENK